MSHRQTITVGFDDRYYNIPTVWNGKKVSNEEAVALARQRLKQGGSFDNFATQEEAIKSAGEVSENQGRMANKKLATITMPDGRTADIFGPEESTREDVMAKAAAVKEQWTAQNTATKIEKPKAATPVQEKADKLGPEGPAELLASLNRFLGTGVSEPALAVADLGKTIISGALGEIGGGLAGIAGALLPGPENQATSWQNAVRGAITLDLYSEPGKKAAAAIERKLSKKWIPPIWRGRIVSGKNEFLISPKEASEELDDVFEQMGAGSPLISSLLKAAVYGAPDAYLGRVPFKGTPALTTAKEIAARSAELKSKVQEIESAAEKAGYKLSNDELPQSIVAVADGMAPERHAAASLDELAENVTLKKQEVKNAVDALYADARSRKAMVEIKPIQEVMKAKVEQLVNDGFDISQMPRVQARLKDFENLNWTNKSGTAKTIDFNNVNILERRLTNELAGKRRGEFNAEDTAILRLRDGLRSHMDDIFNRGAITGDPQAVAAWKAAKDKASYLSRFDSNKVIRDMVREDATPEQIYRWIVGASAMGAKKQSVQVIRELKELIGADNPSIMLIRNAVLRDTLMPAFADTPNFKKLIVNIDKLMLDNPSLAKELSIPLSDLAQMKAAAHAALKTRGPMPEWANRSWLIRSGASVLFGHQIARKGTIVRGAHKIMDTIFKTGVLTRKEIIDHLVKQDYNSPAVVPKSPLWADIMVRGALADLSTDDESETEFDSKYTD